MTARGVVGIVAVAAVAAAVAAGLVLMESPSDSRARRVDERRVNDLVQLERDVEVYRSRHGAPPTSLDDLAVEAGLGRRRTDPESGEPYGYRAVDDTHVELCADFVTETPEPAGTGEDRFWAHGRGRQCFTVDVEETDRDRRGR